MNAKFFALVATVSLFAAVPAVQSASAQIVGGASLSGAYAVTSTEICQISSGESSGQVTQQSVTMTFDTSTGKVAIKGTAATALGYVVPPITGANFRTMGVSKTAKFSLSEGTLKIGTGKYSVQLATLANHGLLAKSFTFVGLDGNCSISGIGVQ
jgi:hypothetical protein